MTAGQQEGFNNGMENIFGGDVEDDDDDNFTIDADDLLKLLDEDFVPDQPVGFVELCYYLHCLVG